MPLNGPRNNAEECFQLHWMGPESQLGDSSDALKWARKVSWETLPMSLSGPRNNAKGCFRCPRMGPEIMPKNASNALEWARKVSWETFPMSSGGPRDNAEGCFPMQLNGPRNNAQECFRFYWMGPEIMPRNASDCIEWAQNISWETLSMLLGGPGKLAGRLFRAKGCFRCP